MKTEEKIKMSIEDILSVLTIGLNNLKGLTESQKNIQVKKFYFLNINTLVCEYYSEYQKSLDIKQEISTITGFLSGFFKGDIYEGIKINYFGIKAFTSNDVELLYAVSTRGAADGAAAGNSIEWIKNTYFQENTLDFRLSRAKTFVSDIENSLRRVIVDIYEKKYGNDWWDKAIDEKISNSIKSTYTNQFGESINDGSVLINYSFTLDLKKIVSADWGAFRHLFERKDTFEDTMVRLNVLRREEAHNREISEQHLLDLEEIYRILLGKIASKYPNIELAYLVEHWRSKVKSIMVYENHIEPTYTMDLFNQSTDDEKRNLIIKDCVSQIEFLDSIISSLKTLTVPFSKKEKHNTLLEILTGYQNLQKEKLHCVTNYEFDDLSSLLSSIQMQLKRMNQFADEFQLSES